MTKIHINENLIPKIVRSIDKAIADDMPQYIRDNRLETNNSFNQKRGDYINENLRHLIVGENFDLIPFNRYSWQGRIIIDKSAKVTYSITTKATLDDIPRRKGRRNPHFLQSILGIENNGVTNYLGEQMTLFPMETFDIEVLMEDYNNIISGSLDIAEGYIHYIIVYKSKQNILQDVTIVLLDKNFNIVDQASLNQYIKPNFERLTSQDYTIDKDSSKSVQTARDFTKVKAGIRPLLKVVEDEA